MERCQSTRDHLTWPVTSTWFERLPVADRFSHCYTQGMGEGGGAGGCTQGVSGVVGGGSESF